MSNSSELNKLIKESEQANEALSLEELSYAQTMLNSCTPPAAECEVTVLGLKWDVASDCLIFDIR